MDTEFNEKSKTSSDQLNAKERILNVLNEKKTALHATEIDALANINLRTYTARLLSELVNEGGVTSHKEGREVYYTLSSVKIFYEGNLNLREINDHDFWDLVIMQTDFSAETSENIQNIINFAFSEMLNNAIDHSHSNIGYAKLWLDDDKVKFIVQDKGIGAFRNIMVKKHLKDETEAIQTLVKGKVTTSARWHSGEGIFWTSRLADQYILDSYGYALVVDNQIDDWTIKRTEENLIGTKVYFKIDINTKKSLSQIFRRYSIDRTTYGFNTTEIPVKLFEPGDVWISRTQAKRLLDGLSQYKKIILDFNGIDVIGQGFADEIFRVFQIHHPEIEIVPIHMSPTVRLMVERAINDPTGR